MSPRQAFLFILFWALLVGLAVLRALTPFYDPMIPKELSAEGHPRYLLATDGATVQQKGPMT